MRLNISMFLMLRRSLAKLALNSVFTLSLEEAKHFLSFYYLTGRANLYSSCEGYVLDRFLDCDVQ